MFHEAEIILKNHLPRGKDEIPSKPNPNDRRYERFESKRSHRGKSQNKDDVEDHFGRLNSRLQVRYADGELERLGIVNLDP